MAGGLRPTSCPLPPSVFTGCMVKGTATPTYSPVRCSPTAALRVRLPCVPLTKSTPRYAHKTPVLFASRSVFAKTRVWRGVKVCEATAKRLDLDATEYLTRSRLGVGLRSVATPAPHPDDRGRLVPPSGGRRGENATTEGRRRA